jgi:hypothetical protein
VATSIAGGQHKSQELPEENCFYFLNSFTGDLVIPKGRLAALKTFAILKKRKHSWHI